MKERFAGGCAQALFSFLVRRICHFFMSFIVQVQNLTAITFELYLHESYVVGFNER